jgi:predicted MFS family arabinose efflux permease
MKKSFLPLILAEMTFTNFGFYAVLALLALHLVEVLHFSATITATLMAVYSVGLRWMRLVLAPTLNRIPPRRALLGSLLVLAVGYGGLAFAQNPWAVGALLLVVGAAYGSNGLIVTTLVSHAPDGKHASFGRYAILSTCTNFAAATAPLIANFLKLEVDASAPFLFASGMVGLTFAGSLWLLPRDLPQAESTQHWRASMIGVFTHAPLRRVMLFTALGWMLYTQKFSSLPLFLHNTLNATEKVGVFFMMNAVIVMLFSFPASALRTKYHIPVEHMFRLSFALYSAGFVLLAFWPTLWVATFAVLLWGVAETLLIPAMNASVAAHSAPSERMVTFAINAAAIGVGEALGNALGVISMENISAPDAYGLLAIVGIACTIISLFSKSPSREPVR